MVVIPLGNDDGRKDPHWAKTCPPIAVIPLGHVISVKLLERWIKFLKSVSVIPTGIATLAPA